MITIAISSEIYDPFFFENEEIKIDTDLLDSIELKELFIHEIAFLSGMNTIRPWENPETFIPALLQEWYELQKEIKALFDQRNNRDTIYPMKRGIGFLIEFIFWSNGMPAKKLNEVNINGLQIKPVNSLERIQFLMKRPNIYPSFAQLCELMEEQQKQYSKFIAMQNAKTKKK